jgi:hypothetical protein
VRLRTLFARYKCFEYVSVRSGSALKTVFHAAQHPDCLRVRSKVRISCVGPSGTKLGRISPCANKSETRSISLTSVLRPGPISSIPRGRVGGPAPHPSAISCLGAFPTPAVSARGWAVMQASENLHRIGREQLHQGAYTEFRIYSFNHFIGTIEQRGRYGQTKRLGGLHVDDQFELRRLLNRKIRRFGALQDPVDVGGAARLESRCV